MILFGIWILFNATFRIIITQPLPIFKVTTSYKQSALSIKRNETCQIAQPSHHLQIVAFSQMSFIFWTKWIPWLTKVMYVLPETQSKPFLNDLNRIILYPKKYSRVSDVIDRTSSILQGKRSLDWPLCTLRYTLNLHLKMTTDRNYMTFCYPKYVLFMTFKIAKYDIKKVKYDIGKTQKIPYF